MENVKPPAGDDKELALHYMQTLVDVARESFLILDHDFRVISANPTFYDVFRVSPKETEGKLLYNLGDGQWDIPELRTLLGEILPENKIVKNYEVRHNFPAIGEKTMLLNARQIDTVQLIVLAIEDITTKKNLEEELLVSGKLEYRLLYMTSSDAIMTINPPDWKFTSGNPAAIKMFGVKDEKEFISLGPWDLSPEKQPDGRLSTEKSKEMIEKAVETGSNFFEWTHKKYKGESFPATVLLSKVKLDGRMYLQATVRDITEQKSKIEELERMNKIMVGRELKMVELKKEIEELEKKLKNK